VEHVEGDILTIFDACYASNLHGTEILSPDPRMFEMLMATGFDKMTAPPGRRSFTAALVHSLRALLKQYGENPFTTRHLCETINLSPHRRKSPSHVWSRFPHYDKHITFGPLKRSAYEGKTRNIRSETPQLLILPIPSHPTTVSKLHEIHEVVGNAVSRPYGKENSNSELGSRFGHSTNPKILQLRPSRTLVTEHSTVTEENSGSSISDSSDVIEIVPTKIRAGDHLVLNKQDIPLYLPMGNLGYGLSAIVEKVRDITTGLEYARKTFKNVNARKLDEAQREFKNEVRVIRRLGTYWYII
jgi:hypothetical protein